jgi:hypothetical protein
VADGRSHHIDYDDPPAELTVAVGDAILVSLPQPMPSRWEPAGDEAALPLVSDETDAAATPRGAPARRTLTFEVRSREARELRLVRRRPWEQEPRETFAVPLRVS